MVKSNKQTRQQRQTQPQRKKKRSQPTTLRGLDKAAVDHVKLMADPCNAPLCYPAYESPGGGALLRYRKIINVGTFAGETAGSVVWLPGINENIQNGAASASSSYVPSSISTFSALQSSNGAAVCTSFRCAAACMTIIPNGSEQNRSGLVYMGNTDSAQVYASSGATVNVEAITGALPFVSRAPAKMAEVFWIPNESDTDWWSDNASLGQNAGSGLSRNALTFAFAGASSAAGYTVVLTAVYEVKYPMNAGIVTTTEPPPSSSSWGAVLRALDRAVGSIPVVLDGVRQAMSTPTGRAVTRVGFNAVARLAL